MNGITVSLVTSNTDVDLQHHKQGFRSEIVLNVFAIHLKKVSGCAIVYGEQFGALALCTATVGVLHLCY